MSSRLRNLNSTRISFFAFQDIITSVSGILILVTLILATALDRPANRTAYNADPGLERKLSEMLRQQTEVDVQNRNLQELLAAAETAPVSEKLESDIARLRAQLAQEKKRHTIVAAQLARNQAAIEARDRTLGLTDLKAQIQRVIEEAEALDREDTRVRREMASLEQRVGSVQSRMVKLRQREGKLWLMPESSSTTKEPILALVSSSGVKVQRFDHPNETRDFSKSAALAGFDSYLAEAKPLNQYIVFLIRPSGIELFGRLVRSAREKGFEVGFDALEEDKDVYYATPPIIDETTPPARSATTEYRAGTGGYSDPTGGSPDVVRKETGKAGPPPRGTGSGAAPPNGNPGAYTAQTSSGSSANTSAPAGSAQQPGTSQQQASDPRRGNGSAAPASEGDGKTPSKSTDAGRGSEPNKGEPSASTKPGKDSSQSAASSTSPLLRHALWLILAILVGILILILLRKPGRLRSRVPR